MRESILNVFAITELVVGKNFPIEWSHVFA